MFSIIFGGNKKKEPTEQPITTGSQPIVQPNLTTVSVESESEALQEQSQSTAKREEELRKQYSKALAKEKTDPETAFNRFLFLKNNYSDSIPQDLRFDLLKRLILCGLAYEKPNLTTLRGAFEELMAFKNSTESKICLIALIKTHVDLQEKKSWLKKLLEKGLSEQDTQDSVLESLIGEIIKDSEMSIDNLSDFYKIWIDLNLAVGLIKLAYTLARRYASQAEPSTCLNYLQQVVAEQPELIQSSDFPNEFFTNAEVEPSTIIYLAQHPELNKTLSIEQLFEAQTLVQPTDAAKIGYHLSARAAASENWEVVIRVIKATEQLDLKKIVQLIKTYPKLAQSLLIVLAEEKPKLSHELARELILTEPKIGHELLQRLVELEQEDFILLNSFTPTQVKDMPPALQYFFWVTPSLSGGWQKSDVELFANNQKLPGIILKMPHLAVHFTWDELVKFGVEAKVYGRTQEAVEQSFSRRAQYHDVFAMMLSKKPDFQKDKEDLERKITEQIEVSVNQQPELNANQQTTIEQTVNSEETNLLRQEVEHLKAEMLKLTQPNNLSDLLVVNTKATGEIPLLSKVGVIPPPPPPPSNMGAPPPPPPSKNGSSLSLPPRIIQSGPKPKSQKDIQALNQKIDEEILAIKKEMASIYWFCKEDANYSPIEVDKLSAGGDINKLVELEQNLVNKFITFLTHKVEERSSEVLINSLNEKQLIIIGPAESGAPKLQKVEANKNLEKLYKGSLNPLDKFLRYLNSRIIYQLNIETKRFSADKLKILFIVYLSLVKDDKEQLKNLIKAELKTESETRLEETEKLVNEIDFTRKTSSAPIRITPIVTATQGAPMGLLEAIKNRAGRTNQNSTQRLTKALEDFLNQQALTEEKVTELNFAKLKEFFTIAMKSKFSARQLKIITINKLNEFKTFKAVIEDELKLLELIINIKADLNKNKLEEVKKEINQIDTNNLLTALAIEPKDFAKLLACTEEQEGLLFPYSKKKAGVTIEEMTGATNKSNLDIGQMLNKAMNFRRKDLEDSDSDTDDGFEDDKNTVQSKSDTSVETEKALQSSLDEQRLVNVVKVWLAENRGSWFNQASWGQQPSLGKVGLFAKTLDDSRQQQPITTIQTEEKLNEFKHGF